MKQSTFLHIRICIVIIIVSLSLLMNKELSAQQILGNSGLFNTPGAFIPEDGHISLGLNYLPQAISPASFDYNTMNYFASHTFLPFLEVGFRNTILKVHRYQEENLEVDRSISAKIRLIKEKTLLPHLSIGGNDIFTSDSQSGNQFFSSAFLVAEKTFLPSRDNLHVSLGYGFDIFAKNQLSGVFGGFRYCLHKPTSLKLIGEFDSHVLNYGFSLVPFKRIHIYGFLSDHAHFAGGFSYQFVL